MGDIRWRVRRHGALAAALATTVAAAAATMAQSPGDKWWTGYGNGPDSSRYFASRQIDRSNVTRLQVAWTYPHGDTGSIPVVVRGVAYGRGRNGSLVAVDAATGKELWVRENMTGMTSRGINYWESADGRDQRLIFSMNSLLQQVDAKTGKSIMSFGTNGVVDLRVGIDGRDPETIGAIQSNTPGGIFENLIILGSAPGEDYMSAPGDIRAYDILTGKLVWTFHTVPRPGEFGYDTWPKDAWKYIGGINNWGETTIDVRRGIVFVPLGSPTYDFYGADRHGANLFGTSIVALDARSGKRRWHFQLVHHDLWDLDPSAAPQLTTIRHQGRNRDVVVVTNKTGWLYVFDRVTGAADLADRRTAGAEERDGRRGELADAAASDQPAAVCQAHVRRRGHQSVSVSGGSGRDQEAPPRGEERGHLHAHRCDRHGLGAGEQRRDDFQRHRGGSARRLRVSRRAREPRHRPAGASRRECRPRRCRAGWRRSSGVSAAVSGLPRPGASRHRHGCAARLRDRRSREQHRRRRAAIRRGGDSFRAGDRKGADAAVPASRQRGRRESRRVPDFGRRTRAWRRRAGRIAGADAAPQKGRARRRS